MRKFRALFTFLLVAATVHAQSPPPQSGPTVIGKGPNIIVYLTDPPALVPPPPSPWSIIKTIADMPNDWALKAALYQPPLDVRGVTVHKKQNPHFNRKRSVQDALTVRRNMDC